jgi:serine/threonine protein kinase, bacterial
LLNGCCQEADVDGTPFGRYRLIELIGRGGMGEVWRAYDPTMDRMVALKLLPPNFAGDKVFQERFRREARAAARLDEPHVVPFHDFGEIDGRLYVTMRLIKGRDLQTILADGPLSSERAVRIIDQVAQALHAAHRIGLIHRDIKPSNILLAENDFAYLIDFGIARAAGDTGLTSTGAAIGTWAYMSPERLNTGHADARADIYALTCVLHEALTGQRPYPGDSLEQQIVGHLTSPPPRPSMLQPGVPEAMDAVIATGMAKQPDQRYASTVELARAARDAITVPIPGPVLSPAPNPPSTERAQPTAPIVGADDTPHAPQPTKPTHVSDPSVAATEHADWVHQPPTQLAPRGPIRPPQPPQRTARLTRRAKIIGLTAAALVVVVVAIIAVVASQSGSSRSAHGSGSSLSSRPSSLPPPALSAVPRPSPIDLPFTGVQFPQGVAVDATGSVYVADGKGNRVLKLAAGAATPTELPFTGLNMPGGVAVDTAGSVYVAFSGSNRVLKLAAGAATPTELPFTGLNMPDGVAVDTAGSVYVADIWNERVLKLPPGAGSATELPFTGLDSPVGVAVDAAGTVYVTDANNNRVLELVAGAVAPIKLPITGHPRGVAVDAAGNVYVVVNSGVLKLAPAAAAPTELRFSGLNEPEGVAVDTAGNVYVTDVSTNRVLKLTAA